MSISICNRCDGFVDTDADVGCYPFYEQDRDNLECVCEQCRDNDGIGEFSNETLAAE